MPRLEAWWRSRGSAVDGGEVVLIEDPYCLVDHFFDSHHFSSDARIGEAQRGIVDDRFRLFQTPLWLGPSL